MKKLFLVALCASLYLMSANAVQAATVSSFADTLAVFAADPQNANRTSPILFSSIFTIDDTAVSGAIFTGDLTVAGVANDASVTLRTNAGGNIVFDTDNTTRQDTLTFTVSNLVQASGPASTITFDGFDELDLSGFAGDATESATFNGVAVLAGGASALTVASSPNGSTFDDTSLPAAAYNFQGISGQFTVAVAVPEPSSAMLLMLTGGVVSARRKRRS